VRRAAFAAASIRDRTDYLCDDSSGRFTNFVQQKSIVEPMRDFALRGIRPRDVMAISLPADYAATDALDLCRRGVQELRSLLS
jgi:hypothetical protein